MIVFVFSVDQVIKRNLGGLEKGSGKEAAIDVDRGCVRHAESKAGSGRVRDELGGFILIPILLFIDLLKLPLMVDPPLHVYIVFIYMNI